MNRSDRLTGILLALQGGRTTAGDLARRFEVSRRTILRDIDSLSQIGVPIVALPGASGGYEIVDGFWLAPLQLTLDEASLLLLALKSLGQSAAPFGDARQSVEEKLRTILPDDLVRRADEDIAEIDLSPPHRVDHLHSLPQLRRALAQKSWLRIDYRSLRRSAEHDIYPLRLFTQEGRWFCSAVSREFEEELTFRIDRIASACEIIPPANSDELIAGAVRKRRASADMHRVVIELTYSALRKLEDHPDFAGPIELARGEHHIEFDTPGSELDFFARELFALGPEVFVVEPLELRQRVIALAESTIARNSAANGDSTVSPFTS